MPYLFYFLYFWKWFFRYQWRQLITYFRIHIWKLILYNYKFLIYFFLSYLWNHYQTVFFRTLILWYRSYHYLTLQFGATLLLKNNIGVLLIYQWFLSLWNIFIIFENLIEIDYLNWFLKIFVLFIFADTRVPNNCHQYRPKLRTKCHFSISVI